MIIADQAVGLPVECDTLFVFAAGNSTKFVDAKTFGWLRQIAAGGTIIAGISAAPYLLARAGLLDGYQATIHWEHRAAFVEAFPMVISQSGLYAIDRRRVTCASGMAGMDLALELIEREQGHKLAAEVSDWFFRSEPARRRSTATAQPPKPLQRGQRSGLEGARLHGG
jgi:transcriptional regulator GlxA family with amidase domain